MLYSKKIPYFSLFWYKLKRLKTKWVKCFAKMDKCKTSGSVYLDEMTGICLCVCKCISVCVCMSMSKTFNQMIYILCWGWFLLVSQTHWKAVEHECISLSLSLCVCFHCDDVISWCYCLTIAIPTDRLSPCTFNWCHNILVRALFHITTQQI